jgi:hypothetical protein
MCAEAYTYALECDKQASASGQHAQPRWSHRRNASGLDMWDPSHALLESHSSGGCADRPGSSNDSSTSSSGLSGSMSGGDGGKEQLNDCASSGRDGRSTCDAQVLDQMQPSARPAGAAAILKRPEKGANVQQPTGGHSTSASPGVCGGCARCSLYPVRYCIILFPPPAIAAIKLSV